jgi:hypothetical protein
MIAQLKEKCQCCHLEVSGKKPVLINRILEDDKMKKRFET